MNPSGNLAGVTKWLLRHLIMCYHYSGVPESIPVPNQRRVAVAVGVGVLFLPVIDIWLSVPTTRIPRIPLIANPAYRSSAAAAANCAMNAIRLQTPRAEG